MWWLSTVPFELNLYWLHAEPLTWIQRASNGTGMSRLSKEGKPQARVRGSMRLASLCLGSAQNACAS
jgi:hypothetical protein